MKLRITLAALLLSAPVAFASDARPAVLPAIWTGCFGEIGVAGHFVKAATLTESASAVGIAGGCDYQSGKVVIGGRLGYDVGKADFRSLAVNGRLGYALNPHLVGYGTLGYVMDGRSPLVADGIVTGGVGIETFVGSTVTIFMEADRDLAKLGAAREITDAWTVRAGARVRF